MEEIYNKIYNKENMPNPLQLNQDKIYYKLCEFEDIEFGTISNVDFKDCKFNNCDLNNFTNCCFTNCFFEGTFNYYNERNFTESNFSHCDFVNCYFDDIDGIDYHAYFDNGCYIKNCEFNYCNLKMFFYDTKLSTGVVFNIINEITFTKCELFNCSIQNAITIFDDCRMIGVTKDGKPFKNYFTVKDDITVYKKVRGFECHKMGSYEQHYVGNYFDGIVTLRIPKGAIVISPNVTKCRTNHAIVESIECNDYKGLKSCVFERNSVYINDFKFVSFYNVDFEYNIGEEILIEDFDINHLSECSNGIHFFMTKEEATKFVF